MLKDYKNNQLELRSEKVRNIIGKIPPRLTRIGITVISLFTILVLTLGYLIPYPQYKTYHIQIYNYPMAQIVESPIQGIIQIKTKNIYISKGELVCTIITQTDSVIKIKALVSGNLYYNCDNKDFMEKNKLIFSIIPDIIDSYYGIFYVPIDELKNIKEGQKAMIATLEKIIPTNISRIYPIPEIDRNSNTLAYKVRVELSSTKLSTDKSMQNPNIEKTIKVLYSNKPILKTILNYN